MTGAPLPVGVVGVGSLGCHHARLYASLPGVQLRGVFDTRAERAAEIAAQFKTRAYPSLEALLADVEAVSVVVPTPAHHEVGLAALGRGRHVLMEKPIAATLPEAEALVAAAGRAGVLLQTGHVERFNRALRAAAPYLASPRFIESDRVAPFAARGSDVAVILDLMIHDLDLVLALVREPVVDVRASGIGVVTPSVDIATARIEFGSGAVANLTASRLARERVRKLRIFQPSGYFSLDLAAGKGEFLRLKPDAQRSLAAGATDLAKLVERVSLSAPEAEPLGLELGNFVRAVRGAEPPAVTGQDGLSALALAFRVMEAVGSPAALPHA
ncbi:MAG TPA: Gfo/Idh/MocA family oxidoreductase [Gemmatimonadales bacterium]|nr:Gfo/Idh/MocA family oxidoreductase [Gemmatimonadales bacterium]